MPISEFPELILHVSATHVITVYTTQSTVNHDNGVSCLQKTNHTTNLTAGGNDNYRICAYSVTTHAQLSKMDCGLTFNKITLCWLLQKMCHATMTTILYLAASHSLILKLPMYFYFKYCCFLKFA